MFAVFLAFSELPKFGLFFGLGVFISVLTFVYKYHLDEGFRNAFNWNRAQSKNENSNPSTSFGYRGYAAAIPVLSFFVAALLVFGGGKIIEILIK